MFLVAANANPVVATTSSGFSGEAGIVVDIASRFDIDPVSGPYLEGGCLLRQREGCSEVAEEREACDWVESDRVGEHVVGWLVCGWYIPAMFTRWVEKLIL